MIHGVLYLLVLLLAALRVRSRWSMVSSFEGLPGVLFCCGLTLFLTTWINFALYFLLGWGDAYVWLTWSVPVVWLILSGPWSATWFSEGDEDARPKRISLKKAWGLPRGEWLFFGFLLVLVCSRFIEGLNRDADGNLWCNFNFVDTAFHLSVVNAFLAEPRFPPIDLDMAPVPLKYHFLADFFVAHLHRIGVPTLSAMWLMNVVSSAVLVGSLWVCFKRWLKLPPAWVLLAGLLFLFLNTSLINLAHFVVLNPSFFRVQAPVDGILLFPFFNFEATLSNLFEPQRALLFSFPVVLFILNLSYGRRAASVGAAETPEPPAAETKSTLTAFVFICLLPFSHIVGFAVMAVALIPFLWQRRREFLGRWKWWAPAFLIGLAQLWYVWFYGPPANPGFADWDASASIPLDNFRLFPEWTRRTVFWLFVNGDFFMWGAGFVGAALVAGGWKNRPRQAWRGLWGFLVQWRWYLLICLGFFALINSYRYTLFWGDSNKFVLFLNLGLALVITIGAARWRGGDGRALSRLLWLFFFALCVGPSAYEIHRDLVASGPGKILIFNRSEMAASDWLRANRGDGEVVLTAAYNVFHFVTSLSGSPTRAGIYGDSNPHRVRGRREDIRLVYENNDQDALRRLDIRYVCLSRGERRRYKLHPRWDELAAGNTAVVFKSGTWQEHDSVFLFDARLLSPSLADAP